MYFQTKTMSVFPIRRIISGKLFLRIVAVVILLLFIALGLLWLRGRAKDRVMTDARIQLDSMSLRITNYLDIVESATHDMVPTVVSNMNPDSLLAYTRRVVESHPDINGCSITTEPGYFETLGRNFSAYSVREGDSISTVLEGEYDYYSKEWYRYPSEKGSPVWVDPYDDFNAGTLSSTDMIASYSVPLYDRLHRFIGVISTDISLPKLSQAVTGQMPIPGSYCMVTGKNGNFLIYPDKDRLIYHTIFDGVNPRLQPDIIRLGEAMVSGKEGQMTVDFDGVKCMVFYQPLSQAGWSIALVCPE